MENTLLDNQQSTDEPKLDRQVRENYDISLLEEKLVVKRHKHKLGKVVVHKEVETQTIHIPIRREKLIVEKSRSYNRTFDRGEFGRRTSERGQIW